jgi:spore germination protein
VRLAKAVILAGIAWSSAGAPLAAAATPRGVRVGGWVTPWDFGAGVERIRSSGGVLSDVLFFVARLDHEGDPVVVDPAGGGLEEAIREARGAGAFVWMTIVNDREGDAPGKAVRLKDAAVVHTILGDPARRREHRARIADLARRLGVAGVDLDYENLFAQDRDLYSAFVRELASDLHAERRLLSVTVQPKASDSGAQGPAASDWAALCAAADRLQIMLYNEHNASTEPGPVASKRWAGAILDFAAGRCDRSKTIPVLKVSGMDWGPAGAEWIPHSRAAALAKRYRARIERDRGDAVPHFRYTDAVGRHTVYFEDTESLTEKIRLAGGRGYGRVVLWSLGSEDPTLLRRKK